MTQTPAGTACSNPLSSALTKNCDYVVPTTCAYVCGKWSDCAATGKKSCLEYAHTPAGAICSNAAPAAQTLDCVYNYTAPVTCSYSCNSWGDCSMANVQTCTDVVTTPTGANCSNPLAAAPVRDCSAVVPTTACVYNCNSWAECLPEGKQLCLGFSQAPALANCTNSKPSSLSRTCAYTIPEEEKQKEDDQKTNTEKTEEEAETGEDMGADTTKSVKPKKTIPCVYEYSAFGACVNGSQSRIVLSQSPADCQTNAVLPVLVATCEVVEVVPRPESAPLPAPAAVTAVGAAKAQENAQSQNYNDRTDTAWQRYYFGSPECRDAAVCGGNADPDNDGLKNNEEYRFGTDPKNSDTDNDGYVDAGEIRDRRDPLVPAGDGSEDKMTVEDPKASPAGNEGIYAVDAVETVGGEKGKKITKLSGKAVPNAYVTLYVFSDPIVMSIETNDDGSWSYVLDRPLQQGNHEVYVVVTDNTGKIVAKSDLFAFAQTAEAAIAIPSPGATEDRAPSPTKSRAAEGYLLVGLLSLGGVALAVVAIGLMRSKTKTSQ